VTKKGTILESAIHGLTPGAQNLMIC